ncbi:MAG: GNAT family N-acetyltransferase [Pseudomonadota bacterium]
MTALVIRKASLDDIEVIIELSDLLNKSQGMTSWTRPLKNVIAGNWKNVDVWVAEYDKNSVGYIAGFEHFQIHNSYSRYVISSLYVRESSRRQGIGTQLLETVLISKKKDNIQQFAIDTLPDKSPEACALYTKFGFDEHKTRYANYRLGFDRLENYYKSLEIC